MKPTHTRSHRAHLVVQIQIHEARDALGELRHLPDGLGGTRLAGVEEAQLQALRRLALGTEPHVAPGGLVAQPRVARRHACTTTCGLYSCVPYHTSMKIEQIQN